MVDEFPTNELLDAKVSTNPNLGDGILIELQIQEYEIDDLHGPSPTKRTSLSFLVHPERAFEFGSSLTLAARYVFDEDKDK